MAYFKEKSMLAMAMKASASSTVMAALFAHRQHRALRHAGLLGRRCYGQAVAFQLPYTCTSPPAELCCWLCAVSHGIREGTPSSKFCHAPELLPCTAALSLPQRLLHPRHRAARLAC